MSTGTIKTVAAWTLFAAMPAAAMAQGTEQGQAIASSDVLSQISMFNYREGPKSDLYFRGTPIAATAEGKGRVEYEDGNAQISANVKNLPEPASLGPYTAYVLWALTPDGRASNQGVIADHEGGKGKMDTQHGASQFALIVTAEPHFAVTVPSTMIALYNVADDVKGEESKVRTLTERADYAGLTPIAADDRDTNAVEIVQARYAVAIARAAGASRYAQDDLSTAGTRLAAAETALEGRRSERRTAPGLAREAVIAAEDARRAAMIGSATAVETAERQAAADAATELANAAAARTAAARAADTERARETESRRATAAAAAAARSDLRAQLNASLPTHESDRGLVSEIGGVQFATGTAEISAAAREGLAKFSGVVASYPALRFQVEGHTDSTGRIETNNELSLRRATAARDYLIGQGVPASSIDVAGLGQSRPIGDNSTSAGRARNRRVEIVISGGPLAAR